MMSLIKAKFQAPVWHFNVFIELTSVSGRLHNKQMFWNGMKDFGGAAC